MTEDQARLRSLHQAVTPMRRMVITTPVVRLAALMDGGVGAIAVTLAPGQTEAVTLPTGTVVEVHRLGQHVTWPAKKRKRA